MRPGCEDVPDTAASDPGHASRGVVVPCAPRNSLPCDACDAAAAHAIPRVQGTKRRTLQSHACRNGALRAKTKAKRKGAETTRRAKPCVERICSALPALQTSHRGMRQQPQVQTLQGSGYLTSGERVASFEKTHVLRTAVSVKSRTVRRIRDRPCGHGLEGTEDDENAMLRSLSK